MKRRRLYVGRVRSSRTDRGGFLSALAVVIGGALLLFAIAWLVAHHGGHWR